MFVLQEPGKTPVDLKWTMFRVPVRVHPLFWVISFLLSYPEGGLTPLYPFSYVLVAVACVFISILVHEYGHAFAGRFFGERENHIVLHWMGGLCVHTKEMKRWPRIAVLLWGPLAGFILGAFAYAAMFSMDRGWLPNSSVHATIAVYTLVWINVAWGLANLLPVFPLDGGQITREIVNWKAPQRGDYFALTISFYSALVVAIGMLVYAYYMNQSASLWGVFLFLGCALQSWYLRQQVKAFGGIGGAQEEPREPWEQDADWWKR